MHGLRYSHPGDFDSTSLPGPHRNALQGDRYKGYQHISRPPSGQRRQEDGRYQQGVIEAAGSYYQFEVPAVDRVASIGADSESSSVQENLTGNSSITSSDRFRRTERIQVICSKCNSPYWVTFVRHEGRAVCPDCLKSTGVDIDW